jgi:hypothetical protein
MSGILASKIYYISSEERTSGTSDNFMFKLSIPDGQKFDRVCVLQASIPQSYYIVAEGSNVFILRELGTDIQVTVPAGNYSVLSLAGVIQALLTSASSHSWVYTVVFPNTVTSANTGKLLYSVTGNGVDQPSFYFQNELHEQFGFELRTWYPFVSGVLQSANVVSFVPETRVFIHSDLGINFDDGDTVLQEIYGNNTAPLSVMSYQLTTDPSAYSKRLRSDNNNSYHFWITDKSGVQLNLNGQDIMITILAYRKDNFTELFRTWIQHSILSQESQQR